MPAPSSAPLSFSPFEEPQRDPSNRIQQQSPVRFNTLPEESIPNNNAGPDFDSGDPMNEPVESQQKLIPRTTKIPRVLDSMRHRLRQAFRRDATVQSAGTTVPRHRSTARTDASARPAAYRRSLPLNRLNGEIVQGLNGEIVQRENRPAASGPLVKLGHPQTRSSRANRSNDIWAMTGDNRYRMAPRQAGPSTRRIPLMRVPLDDEPLELWPQRPSTAWNRD